MVWWTVWIVPDLVEYDELDYCFILMGYIKDIDVTLFILDDWICCHLYFNNLNYINLWCRWFIVNVIWYDIATLRIFNPRPCLKIFILLNIQDFIFFINEILKKIGIIFLKQTNRKLFFKINYCQMEEIHIWIV